MIFKTLTWHVRLLLFNMIIMFTIMAILVVIIMILLIIFIKLTWQVRLLLFPPPCSTSRSKALLKAPFLPRQTIFLTWIWILHVYLLPALSCLEENRLMEIVFLYLFPTPFLAWGKVCRVSKSGSVFHVLFPKFGHIRIYVLYVQKKLIFWVVVKSLPPLLFAVLFFARILLNCFSKFFIWFA